MPNTLFYDINHLGFEDYFIMLIKYSSTFPVSKCLAILWINFHYSKVNSDDLTDFQRSFIKDSNQNSKSGKGTPLNNRLEPLVKPSSGGIAISINPETSVPRPFEWGRIGPKNWQ
ncbi:hypothetical protein CDAR_524591 [Caerostris darwini]|uniref:Uncharacterized protein n=1 Tax=Caerostris darwini TaxID=1538125 RepID=A0AAV4PZ16_9ARAC|nr:hypothetical protein CDAR_524591 [Caerostris darwini]